MQFVGLQDGMRVECKPAEPQGYGSAIAAGSWSLAGLLLEATIGTIGGLLGALGCLCCLAGDGRRAVPTSGDPGLVNSRLSPSRMAGYCGIG